MVALRDVGDAIKLLGDVVKSTREIEKAVNENLLEQMRITIGGFPRSRA
jgi:hypothetical protein